MIDADDMPCAGDIYLMSTNRGTARRDPNSLWIAPNGIRFSFNDRLLDAGEFIIVVRRLDEDWGQVEFGSDRKYRKYTMVDALCSAGVLLTWVYVDERVNVIDVEIDHQRSHPVR